MHDAAFPTNRQSRNVKQTIIGHNNAIVITKLQTKNCKRKQNAWVKSQEKLLEAETSRTYILVQNH